jgi:folate-dependent phosphoribosylglycinamide formyltransferase PurN
LPATVVARKEFPDTDSFSRAVWQTVEATHPDFVLLCGFLSMLRIPPAYEGRVLNIHPALLPEYGGKGYYGERVHRAVLRAGARESGCTVHFVDNEYDHGPILVQRRVPVLPGDTAETLADRVFQAECEAYPEALIWLASGRARYDNGRVRVRAEDAEEGGRDNSTARG